VYQHLAADGKGVPGIVATFDAAVAFALATEGAAMATETAGALGLAVSLKLHSIDDISFVHGRMVVRQREHSVV